jgi:hypothetical protein
VQLILARIDKELGLSWLLFFVNNQPRRAKRSKKKRMVQSSLNPGEIDAARVDDAI